MIAEMSGMKDPLQRRSHDFFNVSDWHIFGEYFLLCFVVCLFFCLFVCLVGCFFICLAWFVLFCLDCSGLFVLFWFACLTVLFRLVWFGYA